VTTSRLPRGKRRGEEHKPPPGRLGKGSAVLEPSPSPNSVHLLSTGGREGRPHPGPLPEGEGTWAGPDRAISDLIK